MAATKAKRIDLCFVCLFVVGYFVLAVSIVVVTESLVVPLLPKSHLNAVLLKCVRTKEI